MSDHWVELRVHGVSGTPPESILGSGFVTQVAGDNRGRFFRPADSFGRERQPIAGRTLEAYHWGRFTSGSWTQALWLLIIPFGIVNAAAFTLSAPTSRRGRIGAAVSGSALRLVGLTMTCLLVFSAAEVALDLFAWQLKGAGNGGHRQWWSVGALALPVGAVVLFYNFGRTNKSGQAPGEDSHNERPVPDGKFAVGVTPVPAPGVSAGDPGRAGAADRPTMDASADGRQTRNLTSELTDNTFFVGDPDAPALRRLHCAAPLHMLAALLLWPAAVLGDVPARIGWWCALALFAGNAVVVALLGDPNQPGGHARWHRAAALGSHLFFVLGCALLLIAAALTGFNGKPTAAAAADVPYRGMPGMGTTTMMLFGGMVGGLVLLLAANALLAASTPALAPDPRTGAERSPLQRKAFRRFAYGMTAWLLASIGGFLSVGFAAAFTFAVENGINTTGPDRIVRSTEFLQRVAYAWGLTVIEIVLLAAALVALYCRRRSSFEAAARRAFAQDAPKPEGLPTEWVSTVGRAMFLARLKNLVPVVFTLFAVTGIFLSVAAGLEQQLGVGSGSTGLAGMWNAALGWLSGLSDSMFGWLVWLGTWTLTALSAALLILGRGALRAEKARRGLNVIWDVVAFWPRRVHPFVPPPYSQHVVAALRRRISWHLGELQDPSAAPPEKPASRVVVAAHSQGSLISLTALLWLTPQEERRVGLVTFGSQLQQQFVRAFPAAIDLSLLEWMWTEFEGRWRNLYRDTDPIAGPVLSWHHQSLSRTDTDGPQYFGAGGQERVDAASGRHEYGPEWRLLDPIRYDGGLMAGPMYRIRGHSDYPEDPCWGAAIAAVLPALPDRLPPEDAVNAGVSDAPRKSGPSGAERVEALPGASVSSGRPTAGVPDQRSLESASASDGVNS